VERDEEHPEYLLTVAKVADKLGVSTPTAWRYLKGSKELEAIPSVKLNVPRGARRVKLGALKEWLKNQGEYLRGPDDPPKGEEL